MEKDLAELIQNDPMAAEDYKEDRVKIVNILIFRVALRLLKIIIIIGTCCYFFAMIFMFVIQIQNEILNYDNFAEDKSLEQSEHFTAYNKYYVEGGVNKSEYDQMIHLLYFSFTSLTTVGFGDVNPRSDGERLFIAFGLLFGVLIFGYIMNQLIETIDSVKLFYKDNGDDDELRHFFEVMKHFN